MALLTICRVWNNNQLMTHRKINILDIGVIIFIRISNTGSQFEKELVHVQVKESGTSLTNGSENIKLADWETGFILLISLLAVNDCEVPWLEMRVGVRHELHFLSNLFLAFVAPQEFLKYLDDAQTLQVCRFAPHFDGLQNLHTPSHKCLHYSLFRL